MRILIEPGSYSCLNLGDMAMLQVAVERILQLQPDASIRVVTRNPEHLLRICPQVKPVEEAGRRLWLEGRALLGRYDEFLPRWVRTRLRKFEKELWYRAPAVVSAGLGWKWRLRGMAGVEPDRFHREILDCDLLMASGMGAWTDAFGDYAQDVFDLFEAAQRRGIATAAFGQGVGPIDSMELWERAKVVLPGLEIIGVRESRRGPRLLQRLGVAPSRIAVTGDDAIELAYGHRRTRLGAGIGVNLRTSPYSETGGDVIDAVGAALRRASHEIDAPLIPVAVSLNREGSDVETICKLLGVEELPKDLTPDEPAKLVAQAGGCRVVVSGSYHAAVFALSQGIPAICLAKSRYYADKFLGLEEQFGAGCTVLPMNDGRIGEALSQTLRRMWDSAEQFQGGLLARAATQIDAGRAAYQRLFGNRR